MQVQLNNVTKTLRGTQVIRGVSAELVGGKVYGLQGYNGCGKTMLLRLIAGLIYPTTGTILVNGKQLGKELDFPDSVGLIIENPAFLDDHTGLVNLRLIAKLRGTASEAELCTALERVGLDPADKRRVRKYSLGMKQRLAIAMAIAEKPELILLDEPTNALDAEGLSTLKDIIVQERDRGALVILASHDAEFLHAVTDRIFPMEFGRFVDLGEET